MPDTDKLMRLLYAGFNTERGLDCLRLCPRLSGAERQCLVNFAEGLR